MVSVRLACLADVPNAKRLPKLEELAEAHLVKDGT
jgi:hypothetical protein